MVEFTRELRTTNGQNFVYVRPRDEVADDDWVDHFINQFSNVPVPEFFMLVDLIGVDDNIGLDGFSRLSNLINTQGFDRTRIAMLHPTSVTTRWRRHSISLRNLGI